ncbi:hypothetical protein D3C87_2207520 [compost metagenome]
MSGNFDTHFVKKYFNGKLEEEYVEAEAELAAVIALKALEKARGKSAAQANQQSGYSSWRMRSRL